MIDDHIFFMKTEGDMSTLDLSAIFKKLITSIDGYENIESNDNKGSTFTFTLAVSYR